MNNIKFHLNLLFVAMLLAVATPVLAVQSLQTSLADIRHLQFDDSFELLMVGETEIPMVKQESHTPITRGVAVLVSEAGQHAMAQSGLRELAEFLNDVGWVTMTIPAPDEAFTVQAAAPADTPQIDDAAAQGDDQQAATQSGEQAETDGPHPSQGLPAISAQQFEQHEQQLMLHMQAIVQKTREYPGFFLVIAQGTSAAWLTKIYAQQKLDIPDGMVAISPLWPDRNYNLQLPDYVAQTPMPYLDIYNPWDPSWSLDTVQARQVAAKKALKMIYRQRELVGTKMDNQQFARLGKEIYGWLTHMGW